LTKLQDAGFTDRGLVMDLRGNTGGSMIQSARVADQFLREGLLVRTVGHDGRSVTGLIPQLKALYDPDKPEAPDVPLVILQDHRTASGSEIVAGALRELDRAILIGTRSYGKGTVQKVYTLRSDTRLKLTVAKYLLPGDLSIRDIGLAPDLEVGRLIFDGERGIRQKDGTDQGDPLIYVDSRLGVVDGQADYLEALAVDIIHQAAGAYRRDELLAALAAVERARRREEENRIISGFSQLGIVWSPSERQGGVPDVSVEVDFCGENLAPRSGAEVALCARVHNLDDQPLHRVMVRTESDDSAWRDRLLPIGRIDPGQVGEGRVRFTLPAGRQARSAQVELRLQADQRPTIDVEPATLTYAAAPTPPLTLEIGMENALSPDGDGNSRRAKVDLINDSDVVLRDVRVRFEHPSRAGVELTQYDATLSQLAGGERQDVGLGLRLLDDAPAAIPMVVHVRAADFGGLLEWPIELPADGRKLRLSGPRVALLEPPLSAPVGALTLQVSAFDDHALGHVVIWSGGEKIAYRAGGQAAREFSIPVEVALGSNRYTIEAADDQGLRTRDSWYVLGVDLITTDAESAP
jgi:carboxyl-terminal processing protease